MKICLYLMAALLLCTGNDVPGRRVIYHSKAYTVYEDGVVQGKNIASAISATEMTSNYQSPANQYINPVIDFKFSINGKDNEMPSGQDDHFACIVSGGKNETPLIKFGQQYVDKRHVPANCYLKPGTMVTIRLDMRDVLAAFKKAGYYICFNGEKIYKDDFRGVFIAGKPSPLIWDFNNLVNHQGLKLEDPDGDGIYETTLTFGTDDNKTAASWKLSRDISAWPQYHSGYKISDALYNLSLEEMEKAIEPDSTFRTGKEWSGVWTRDISYSIILSMAVLQPKVAMYSLMHKVKNGRVIQDTGTGGAYPVSSDRMIWAVAAWEIYKVTDDRDWLKKAYAIIKKSVGDDEKNVYDTATGLVHGESSFLDWREETYPRWMQPAAIYQSECLGTNAVHYQVNRVLASMATTLGDSSAAEYTYNAEVIKTGMNKYLWMPASGYYGQYLYGRNYSSLSTRAEALGEALAVLFGIADAGQQQSIIARTPVTAYGISCIYPQIPDILPYHNNAVWPFVETYWAMASAKAGNEASLLRAISAVYRPGALFLTNKENFVAADGDYAGTQINSSNMLWSLSGNIAIVYKILFGMKYDENSLMVQPFVPKAMAGERTLINYHYRNAQLDITMTGFGNKIKSITLDGSPLANASIPATLTGKHCVKIVLADNTPGGTSNMQPNYTAPETPIVKLVKNKLTWSKIKGAVYYQLIKNGKYLYAVTNNSYALIPGAYAEYQVAAVDANGVASFKSEPVATTSPADIEVLQAEEFAPPSSKTYQGYTGKGFVEVSTHQNRKLKFRVNIKQSGYYSLDIRYANGNGPINTENKCAIRTLNADNKFAGTYVLPQRGKAVWSDWGFSNPIRLRLTKGMHNITLAYEPANENMNGDVNEAMVDYLRVTRLN